MLYATIERKTAVYEVRPSIGDAVTVGCFELAKDLRMCDLRRRHEPCRAFVESDDAFQKYLEVSSRNRVRAEIGRELAIPVRPGDEKEKYLPTQVFAAMVQELGFDGLMFSSSQHEGGENVVLFDPDAAILTKRIREVRVDGVRYAMRKLR